MTSQILTSFQFSMFRKILATEGLDLTENARKVFELRIQRFADRHGFQLDQLPFLLKRDEKLRVALAERLLIHESYFYREIHHLTAMTQHILPELAALTTRPISILSAGCASGEEAYSIRISILDALPQLSSRIKITGIDRSKDMVDAAKAGRYSIHALREMPAHLVEQYFTKDMSALHSINSEVREGIDFFQFDLLKESLKKEAYDIIFCRNVMMYLTSDAREKLKSDFEAALKPGGSFFFGTTEVIANPPGSFRKCRFGKVFFFRKAGERS